MRIIYFGGSYYPSLEERTNLEKVQIWLRETNASILVDCRFDNYQYVIRRQQLADKLRSKWVVIQGGRSA
jgi:hypothetical protein